MAFSASSSGLSCADPRCSISRDPRGDEHTTCTAVVPDVVFTVRMYGIRPLYGPRLVQINPARTVNPQVSATRSSRTDDCGVVWSGGPGNFTPGLLQIPA